jgi:hypothetical protein
MKKISVLHLPTTVGGNPQGISKSLNQIGIESETWTLKQNYFAYPADKVICSQSDGLFMCELKRILALRYVFKSNIVFFNFGKTLFDQLPRDYKRNEGLLNSLLSTLYRGYAHLMQRIELFLLRVQKKIIFVQYQGDDARQADYSLAHFAITPATQVEPGYYSEDKDILKREQIKLITSACNKIYALNPDLLYILPQGSEFLPYSHISLENWTVSYTQMKSRPLRICHAPSHRVFKGTKLILDALDALKREGFEFELILVEGLNNAEAKEIYRTVDVFVDQLFAGWYGGLAVEAMALGKPVIAYIRQEDLHFIPVQMRADLPIIQAEPSSIRDVLEDILKMPRTELLEKAQRSRAYVEKWHDPMIIAKRIKTDMLNALKINK